jgi:hypothetical protein
MTLSVWLWDYKQGGEQEQLTLTSHQSSELAVLQKVLSAFKDQAQVLTMVDCGSGRTSQFNMARARDHHPGVSQTQKISFLYSAIAIRRKLKPLKQHQQQHFSMFCRQ